MWLGCRSSSISVVVSILEKALSYQMATPTKQPEMQNLTVYMHFKVGIVLSPLWILIYLILITSLWGEYSDYPHFTNEEHEAQRN